MKSRSHLRAQVTLLASAQGTPSLAAAEVTTVLVSSGRHFPGTLFPSRPLAPGGSAVDCDIAFIEPAKAAPHFPAGVQFDIWERGRKGYGTVLKVFPYNSSH